MSVKTGQPHPLATNVEFHPIDNVPVEQAPRFTFETKERQTLNDCVKDLIETSGALLKLVQIEGYVCITPVAASGDSQKGLLDRNITLDLDNVPTWQALKMVAQLVNSTESNPKLYITPYCTDVGFAPPPQFAKQNAISISVKDQPVRSVICALMKQSPLHLSYVFIPSEKVSILHLYFYDEGGQRLQVEHLDPEQRAFWQHETDSEGWRSGLSVAERN